MVINNGDILCDIVYISVYIKEKMSVYLSAYLSATTSVYTHYIRTSQRKVPTLCSGSLSGYLNVGKIMKENQTGEMTAPIRM